MLRRNLTRSALALAIALTAVQTTTLLAPTAVAKPTVARPTATPSKKKSKKKTKTKPVATKAQSAGARKFSCLGTNEARVTERLVTGTVDSKINLTNVTVTQNFQLVDNTLVEQPTVVLTSPSPPGAQDAGSDLIVFRLNERPNATAADVDKLFVTYRFNFKNVLPPGPTFVAGLYFTTHKGVAGPAANEYRWSLISSLSANGAYGMQCQYL